MSYDYMFKCIIIGDSGVGKSSLLLQFIDKRFVDTHEMTIGVEFGSRTVTINGKSVRLQVWDTAGQETFRSVTRAYYRDASIVLLVYDTTNMASFNAVANWLEEVQNSCKASSQIILVGNKCDLENKRQVLTEMGANFAKVHGMMFIETSAKRSTNVDDAFYNAITRTLYLIQKGDIEVTLNGENGIKMGHGQIKPLLHDSYAQEKKCCSV